MEPTAPYLRVRNFRLRQIVPQSLAPGYPHGTLVPEYVGMEAFVTEGAEDGRTVRGAERVSAAALGVRRLGERATLVQFSSAFCQPCRATRRTLAQVAAMVGGVAHLEIDAEEHLELVRELGITGTPTVLVLDRDGRIVKRATGQPRKADVIAALGAAIG